MSRFVTIGRDEWRRLRDATPLTLSEADLEDLRGINERIDLTEVADIYLPLSRLLNLHVAASQELDQVSARFLGTEIERVPYIIGIAGSVAVGKSTFARILQALLARWPDHPKVDLVTKYPREQLPESLTGYIRDRQGYDYLHHAEVGSDNAGFVTDEVVDRFCVLGEPAEHVAKLRELRDAGVDQFNIYLMNGDEEAQLEAYGRDVIPALAEA